MYWRLHKLKRFIAACGVALMLLECVQQAHALCQLTGCQPKCEAEAGADCCQHSGKQSCQRNHRRANQSPGLRMVRACCQHSAPSPACPNSENCVCCQAAPVGLPVSITAAPSDVDLCHAHVQLSPAVASGSLTRPARASLYVDASTADSLATCVRLCRFLV
jgi:hypothetical protein